MTIHVTTGTASSASGAARIVLAARLPHMLAAAELVAFAPTTDMDRAAAFYGDLLGLTIVDRNPYATVCDAHGTMLRITAVPELKPHPFTVLGWDVDDIGATIRGLVERGVAFERFDGMEQDELGIWDAPGGGQVAWFHDPDGNTLSLTQFVVTSA